MKVYFVGAGPGDPDLITKKGEKLLNTADTVVYTGSLINPKVLDFTSSSCELYDSSGLTKEELIDIMLKAVENDKLVVRLHTGDPGLYGAIQEQIDVLQEKGITTDIVPGISAYQGAMATLKRELTLPGITQTVILTRLAKKTPVPEKERLRYLASHQSTICIYLSTHILREVISELIEGGMSIDTPVTVVYKATWPEEQVISGTLNDINDKVIESGIKKTALIIVGEVLTSDSYTDSYLYRSDFTHGYRVGDSNE
ncbi:precorrin-4 C(11)-methyltransferase [Natranaerobius trueperi]|uniref:Precorrin-4 C(11)-methyltransferase n=1 Tax=Natranaerobius trueperi TaxID=759412 RepID=A0A226BVH1_9FIRM|nr:precorrin-4 C(11)-methyltransferase [Natranaerobius trueperi]OWZ82975.1 precorrin-4 C(11)-methyltransferase [Natranaerobius trueperi]